MRAKRPFSTTNAELSIGRAPSLLTRRAPSYNVAGDCGPCAPIDGDMRAKPTSAPIAASRITPPTLWLRLSNCLKINATGNPEQPPTQHLLRILPGRANSRVHDEDPRAIEHVHDIEAAGVSLTGCPKHLGDAYVDFVDVRCVRRIRLDDRQGCCRCAQLPRKIENLGPAI